ncbi:MAG TPA: thermonuclease family protein [Azospirillaceae bacterium]|nr:thermonuclease family protein [Azospirillaceae bacterium]
MFYSRSLPVLLALLAVPALAADQRERVPGPVAAEVLDIVDGDTLSVRVHLWLGQELHTKVRLDGVDTPEKRSRCDREKELAREAERHLEGLVVKRRVLLYNVANDKFGGRVRARVVLPDGTDLAAALVSAGYARPYHGEARQPWCGGPLAAAPGGP